MADLKIQNLMIDFKKKVVINDSSDFNTKMDDNETMGCSEMSDNETISEEACQKIIDGKYCHGQYFTYWDNGSIATITDYCNNTLHGRQTFRYSTTHGYKLGYQYRRVDGEQHGIQETWFSNGSPKGKWFMFHGTEINENGYFRYLNLIYGVISNSVKDQKLTKLIGEFIVDFDD